MISRSKKHFSVTRRVVSVLGLSSALLFAHHATASKKVAFVADQGTSSSAKAVLSLIKSEGADVVLVQGDLGYHQNTALSWDSNLNDILGSDFPVLTVVGNHENYEWPLYQRLIERRLERSNGFRCTGEIGVKADCRFDNIQVVQVAPAIYEVDGIEARDDYPQYISDAFANSDATWRICSWHKNMSALQVATKDDSVGWDAYDACLDAGAMVVNGHAHTYSRTHLLSDYSSQRVASTSSNLKLERGRSFTAVSGLGGHDIKKQSNGGDWFASVYTASQGATHGALFCEFDVGDASCYFKAIDGSVPDQFTLSSAFIASNRERPDSSETGDSIVPVIDAGSDGDDIDPNNVVAGVFSRTDKKEYRWIAPDRSGQWGNIWIEESCVESLGGVSYRGDWATLVTMAPAWDAITNPCSSNQNASVTEQSEESEQSEGGFVFSRTDKNEYRWIDRDSQGVMSSVWIDPDCVDDFGGVKQRGDWSDLRALTPAFDTIDSPSC